MCKAGKGLKGLEGLSNDTCLFHKNYIFIAEKLDNAIHKKLSCEKKKNL